MKNYWAKKMGMISKILWSLAAGALLAVITLIIAHLLGLPADLTAQLTLLVGAFGFAGTFIYANMPYFK
jgi:hypothetical protein